VSQLLYPQERDLPGGCVGPGLEWTGLENLIAARILALVWAMLIVLDDIFPR